jgi:SAM-dependent methyltransferase
VTFILIDRADFLAAPCDVCDSLDFEILTHLRSPRMINLSSGIAICRNCGFVTQRPRPGGATCQRINDTWFSETFVTDSPTTDDDAKKYRKWELMWRRIGAVYPKGPGHLLDVGAGQGWAIEYLRSLYPDMDATAIERWEPCQDYIRNKLGADVVAAEPDGPWPDDFKGRFDLIILRHTLEHLNEPLQALRNIVSSLAPGGLAYIVVPNGGRIAPRSPMRTDFFRPVHLHYFNEHTFRRLLARAGLSARLFGAESELWGLFGHAVPDNAQTTSSYTAQRSLLVERLTQSVWRDRKTIVRSWLSHYYRRMFPAAVRPSQKAFLEDR